MRGLDATFLLALVNGPCDGVFRMPQVIGHEAPSEIVIDRVPAPSQAEFERQYLHASQPAIFNDVVPRWRAWERWSRDYFRQVWGKHRAQVMITSGRNVQYDPNRSYAFREMPMDEALDRLERGSEDGAYLMVPLERYLPGLLDDVEVPSYCDARPGFRTRLWINAADIGTPLHRDFSENLIAQVRGTKRLILYPPEAAHSLYAFQRRSLVPGFSPVNAEVPDPVRFPRSVDARRVVVTLHAGEMLFLPSRWWHQVRSIEPSLNINFWWAAGVYEKIIRVAERLGLKASV